jgi:RNA polymerase sigma factor (sigma-70 family)
MGDAPPITGVVAEIERLYRQDGPRLWRAILAFTGDPDLTNEVVAETFAQCLYRGAAVRSPANWVWRSAFRIAAGQLKERGRRGASATEDIYEAPDRAMHVLWALRQLPARQRAVVVLRYYLGYTAAEIADLIGTAPPTVRVHLMRGLRRLRSVLEEE